MRPDAVYWDKPDLAADLREMGDNLFPGLEHALRRAVLHSAARRIDHLEEQLASAGVSQPLSLPEGEKVSTRLEEREGSLVDIVRRLSAFYGDDEIMVWLTKPHPQLGCAPEIHIHEGAPLPILAVIRRLEADGYL